MKYAVTVKDLRVQRSTTFQLQVHQLALRPASVLCITGSNGSGKTTLIECLSGILEPDTGTVAIEGRPVSNNLRSSKARVGFIPDNEDWLIGELCAAEYFELLEHIYRQAGSHANMHSNMLRLSSILGFNTPKVQLNKLSHGNKKKVQLIAGLMHEPSVVIVDELRNGLDPLAILAAEDLIQQQAKRGACVVAATHDLWWAERIANEVMLLHSGNILVKASKPVLLKQYGTFEKMFRTLVPA